jgi:hypothetical protein
VATLTAPTVTMVSLTGREQLTEETIAMWNQRGGLGAFVLELFYFAPEGKHRPLNVPDNVHVHAEIYRGMIPDFFRILSFIPDGTDWIFLEDDVTCCTNALQKMAYLDVPEDVGVVSFFDLRNEFDHPGLWRDRQWEEVEDRNGNRRRHLYGAQALKIPARVIPALKKYAKEERRFSANWDTWLGLAIDDLNLRVAHWAPSLVQHLGVISVAYPTTTDSRPLAHNFPGENFDALGPCSDPIVPGRWTRTGWDPTEDPRWCGLHRRLHVEGNRCPKARYKKVTRVDETAGPPVTMQEAYEQGFTAGLEMATQKILDARDRESVWDMIRLRRLKISAPSSAEGNTAPAPARSPTAPVRGDDPNRQNGGT